MSVGGWAPHCACWRRPARGRLWIVAFVLVVATACGSGGGTSGLSARATDTTTSVPTTVLTTTTTEATTTTSVAPTTTTIARVTSTVPSSATTTSPPLPRTTAPATSPSVFAGRYHGSTGASGGAVINADGSGQFDNIDPTACPSCSNASAPHATISFELGTVTTAPAGGYRATGLITAESDPADAAKFAGPVGSSIVAQLTAAGGLTFSFLPSNDVLIRY